MGRRIDVLSALLVAVSGLQVGHDGEDWRQVWDALLSIRKTDGRAAIERANTLASALEDPLRWRLLDAVSGVDGAPVQLSDALPGFGSLAEWPLAAAESWIAAEVVPDGPVKVMCVVSALRQTREGLEPDQLILAHEAAMSAAEDLRLDEAVEIQRALHDRYSAEWSAVNLATTLKRMGAYEDADDVLADQERRGASPDLGAQRGILSLACGDEVLGRARLGSCLRLGSLDAAQVLARLDLASGRQLAARRAFGALLTSVDPRPWALYGWGLSLVEPPLESSTASAPVAEEQ